MNARACGSRDEGRKLTWDDAVEIVWPALLAGEKQHRIAARLDVNGGRISEINTGKLHPGSKEATFRIMQRDH